MHKYEVMFIIQADLDEASTQGVIEKVTGWITESGGTVEKVDNWGKRQLAYRIRKQREGVYVLLHVNMPPAFSAELERNLRFLEPVLRFLIIAVD
ncbi:MAG: 30S ribosomal protein S6 [Anaerolineae bacterium]|nr:30S ribosomal protein S6 [Anaerolineae bacterium]